MAHFGFKQSWNGKKIDQIKVYMFFDGLVNGQHVGPHASRQRVFLSVPGDPNLGWAPNYYRAFSVVMHEYAHIVFQHYRQREQFQAHTIEEDPEQAMIAEGLAVFWPSTIMDEPKYGRTLWPPWIDPPDLSQDCVYLKDTSKWYCGYDPTIEDPFLRLAIGTTALTAALWNLREHPRIGKTNAENLLWEAMAFIPHQNAKLGHVTSSLVFALLTKRIPQEVKNNLRPAYIISVFAKQNIPLTVGTKVYYASFLEEQNNLPDGMRPGETRNITITFKNYSPMQWNAPRLLFFNPTLNPNVDKPGVITSYNWGVTNPINPQSMNPVPPQGEIVFNFRITAPRVPGTYACDWTIQTDDGKTGYIVSKDITIR